MLQSCVRGTSGEFRQVYIARAGEGQKIPDRGERSHCSGRKEVGAMGNGSSDRFRSGWGQVKGEVTGGYVN